MDIGVIANAILPLTLRFVACVNLFVAQECIPLATVLDKEGIPVPASMCPTPAPPPSPQMPGGGSENNIIIIAAAASGCVVMILVVVVVVFVVLPRRRRVRGYRIVSN